MQKSRIHIYGVAGCDLHIGHDARLDLLQLGGKLIPHSPLDFGPFLAPDQQSWSMSRQLALQLGRSSKEKSGGKGSDILLDLAVTQILAIGLRARLRRVNQSATPVFCGSRQKEFHDMKEPSGVSG